MISRHAHRQPKTFYPSQISIEFFRRGAEYGPRVVLRGAARPAISAPISFNEMEKFNRIRNSGRRAAAIDLKMQLAMTAFPQFEISRGHKQPVIS